MTKRVKLVMGEKRFLELVASYEGLCVASENSADHEMLVYLHRVQERLGL